MRFGKPFLITAAAMAAMASPFTYAGTLAQDKAALQSVNAALQQAASQWPKVQQAAASYAQFASYASRAGIGPTIIIDPWGIAQCHNVQWDNMINQLVTGGLNIGGDGEAEAYALQTLAIQWVTDALQVEEDQTQAIANSSTGNADAYNQHLQQMSALSNTLDNLLNTVANQIAAATGPNSALQQLPLNQNWMAGIGDYPNLAAVQWIAGPNDGLPIGWEYLYPLTLIERQMDGPPQLKDLCPTGSANIPMESDAGILQAANTAVQVQPDFAPQLQSLLNGSQWSLNGQGYYPGTVLGIDTGYYQTRQNLVSTLGYDEGQISNYMIPVNADVATFAADAQQLTTEILNNEG